jgi:hypothetical protein
MELYMMENEFICPSLYFLFFLFFFFLWNCGLNSGLCTYKEGTLLLEPQLQFICHSLYTPPFFCFFSAGDAAQGPGRAGTLFPYANIL